MRPEKVARQDLTPRPLHEYGEIKQERMWIVASSRIPELIAMLEPLVPDISAEE